VPNYRTVKCRETKHKENVPYLKLLEKFTAKPQDVFDLFDPQEREILGECQRHVPHLRKAGCKREQRSAFVILTGRAHYQEALLQNDLLSAPLSPAAEPSYFSPQNSMVKAYHPPQQEIFL